MSQMNNTLYDYQDFVRTLDEGSKLVLPEFKLEYWQFKKQVFSEAKQLNEVLKQMALSDGWLTLTSSNLSIEDYQYDGLPLSGQACNASQSIQINWTDSHWELIIIETAKGNTEGEGEGQREGIVCQEKQLAKDESLKYLCFESLWQNIDGAMRKTATRFTGVEK